MANSINTNIAAYYAQANISRASNNASSSIARLSSGNRIVKASDDVAALSVGTSLRTQVNTLRTALVNAGQGSSLLQVADGAVSQIVDILQRQKSIATQAVSGSLTGTERGYLNQEFQALTAQIDQISSSTNFNGVNLIGGGLGNKLRLSNTNALTALFVPTAAGTKGNTATTIASTAAIQAFSLATGAILNGSAAAGKLDVVDSAGTVLANGAYDGVNTAVRGKFSKFDITDVVYGVAAKVTATINGVDFSGTVATGATTATLQNGNTFLKLGVTALTFTNAGTVEAAKATLSNDFRNTSIQSVVQVQGVDFGGTRLAGTKGSATAGIAMARLNDPTRADIRNFAYAGNTGAANSNILTVEVNGKTFTARSVLDLMDDTAAATYTFEDGAGQALTLNITGLVAGSGAITNIRTSATDQAALINALNIGFSRAGGGLSFAVGSTTADSVAINIKSASSVSLFNGSSLNVATSADATVASASLDTAIKAATALRADIGGLQSRFNYISANLESSVQNQDAARGVLLDTDVAAESTSFATSQVQLQAGISVLAQANLLTQNLLKLIG